MTDLETAEQIAEKLRNEPYRLFSNNCFIKSARLCRECRQRGVPARAVACIGMARARLFGWWCTMPAIHGWAEVEGKRIEVSRPLGHEGIWHIRPPQVKPVIAIWFK